MKKIVLLIISLLLITGCSVKYNLTINEDLTIIENAKMTGTSEFFNNYYKTTKKNVLSYLLDMYKEELDNNGYKYELINDKIPYVDVTRKYDNMNDYLNNTILFNGIFDKIVYTEDGNIKKLETIGYNSNEQDNPDRFVISELEIAIKCPYKVVNHNAKSSDKKTNTYYFTLDKASDYKILLEYDVSSKFNPNSELIMTIIIGILVLIAIWMVVYFLNKKQNK